MQQDGLRIMQEERKAREKGHTLRDLQGLLDRLEEARQVQGALIPIHFLCFYMSSASQAPTSFFLVLRFLSNFQRQVCALCKMHAHF